MNNKIRFWLGLCSICILFVVAYKVKLYFINHPINDTILKVCNIDTIDNEKLVVPFIFGLLLGWLIGKYLDKPTSP